VARCASTERSVSHRRVASGSTGLGGGRRYSRTRAASLRTARRGTSAGRSRTIVRRALHAYGSSGQAPCGSAHLRLAEPDSECPPRSTTGRQPRPIGHIPQRAARVHLRRGELHRLTIVRCRRAPGRQRHPQRVAPLAMRLSGRRSWTRSFYKRRRGSQTRASLQWSRMAVPLTAMFSIYFLE